MGPGRPGIPGSPGLPIGPGSSSHCRQWSMLGAPEIVIRNYIKTSVISQDIFRVMFNLIDFIDT